MVTDCELIFHLLDELEVVISTSRTPPWNVAAVLFDDFQALTQHCVIRRLPGPLPALFYFLAAARTNDLAILASLYGIFLCPWIALTNRLTQSRGNYVRVESEDNQESTNTTWPHTSQCFAVGEAKRASAKSPYRLRLKMALIALLSGTEFVSSAITPRG